jgi:HPt (histidine-containing phosphotransfer) domain-containing protein
MQPPVFDHLHIDENWGGPNDDGFRLVLGLFAEDAAALRAALGAGLARGDRAALAHAAHSLKGAAANVGAFALSQCAAALEDQAAIATPSELESGLDALDQALEAVRAALDAGGPFADGS